MDWQKLINQFTPLTREDVLLFAPPREMEQAISTYNRAVFNLNNNSMDIAMIALRKLAVTYPMFSHASLLLGYCQALAGHLSEAADHIDRALLTDLPDDLRIEALACKNWLLSEQTQLQATQNGVGNGESAGPESFRMPAAVLEKSRKRNKVRMASEKERKSVIRRGEFPEEEETHVEIGREPIEYLRIGLPVLAGLLVISFLVFAGIRWLPGLFKSNGGSNADTRLEWLLGQMDTLSAKDAEVSQLLDNYHHEFDPTPTPTTTTESTTAASTTATTTASESETTATSQTTATTTAAPAVTPTAEPAAQALQQANTLYQQAQATYKTNLAAAADKLLTARTLLADVPDQTTAANVTGDARTVSASVETLISSIGKSAAEKFRVPGMDLFDNKKDYQGALSYFLKAYQLYPKAYGGGVAYYCGRCYQELKNKTAAKPYYDFVIKNFAGRDIARSAAVRLQEMGY